jgi:hypothetical protein
MNKEKCGHISVNTKTKNITNKSCEEFLNLHKFGNENSKVLNGSINIITACSMFILRWNSFEKIKPLCPNLITFSNLSRPNSCMFGKQENIESMIKTSQLLDHYSTPNKLDNSQIVTLCKSHQQSLLNTISRKSSSCHLKKLNLNFFQNQVRTQKLSLKKRKLHLKSETNLMSYNSKPLRIIGDKVQCRLKSLDFVSVLKDNNKSSELFFDAKSQILLMRTGQITGDLKYPMIEYQRMAVSQQFDYFWHLHKQLTSFVNDEALGLIISFIENQMATNRNFDLINSITSVLIKTLKNNISIHSGHKDQIKTLTVLLQKRWERLKKILKNSISNLRCE